MNDKPRVNVGTIGHVDHGRTTLMLALLKAARNMIIDQPRSAAKTEPMACAKDRARKSKGERKRNRKDRWK